MTTDKQNVLFRNIQKRLNTLDEAKQDDDTIIVSFYSDQNHQKLVLTLWIRNHTATVATSVAAPVHGWKQHAAAWQRAEELVYYHNLTDG